jgi:mono/diheme cytochrome c family protein
MRLTLFLFLTLLPLTLIQERPPAPPASEQDPAPAPATDARGLYALHCSPCHGETGRGDGPAARFLDPPPRDFKTGAFRFVTTTNGIPSDKDLFEVIAAGLNGTAMLPFGHLPHDQIGLLVEQIRGFHREGLRERYRELAESEHELEEWVRLDTTAGPAIPLGVGPPDNVEARARGRLHFVALCSPCHGTDGRGRDLPDRQTVEGYAVRSRNFTHGVIKGGSQPDEIFRRIRAGLPGTPMPSTPESALGDARVWELVHYLGTLLPRGAQELHDAIRGVIPVARIEGPLPTAPDDARFESADPVHVALAPFRAADAAAPGVIVRALHDGENIILQMRWPDATLDRPDRDRPTAPDGAAIRLTNIELPPVLPIPGLPLPLDRALWVAGPMPPPDDPVYAATGFENPDSVCKAPIGPQHVGAGTWRDGIWTALMAVRPEKAGEVRVGAPMQLSIAIFDGATTRGPLPQAFSNWQILEFR